ncbi:MAG: TonB family protein, partial [Candidatus Acidiferrales bacterium]
QPTNGFWGVYFPQDAVKSAGGTNAPVTMAENTPKPQPITSTFSATPASVPAPAATSIPAGSASRPKAPTVVPASPDDFWGSSFPTEVIAPAVETAAQSNVPPVTTWEATVSSAQSETQSVKEPAIQTPSLEVHSPEPSAHSASSIAPKEEKISGEIPPHPSDAASSSVFAQPPRPELKPVVTSSDPWGKDAAVELPPVVVSSSLPIGSGSFPGSAGLATLADEVHQSKEKEAIKLSSSADPMAKTGISSAASPPSSPRRDWETFGGLEASVGESPLSSVPDLLGSQQEEESTPISTPGAHSSSRTMILVGAAVAALFVVGAVGFFFSHRSSSQPTVVPANPPVVASSTPPPASVEQSIPSASNTVSTASPPPIVAKQESQPVREATNSTARVSTPVPAAPEPPAKKPAWAGQVPKGNLLHPTGRSAKTNGQDAPPELTGAASNAPADAIAGVLPGSTNSLPAPPPAPEHPAPLRVGGRLKEPRLTLKVLPVYPAAAKQVGLEGKVVIDAVVDATGKVTNMKPVSGPMLLQAAALDAVRKWKYEPTYLDDKPVAVQMFITVEFHLR